MKDIADSIKRLKEKRKAVILAHNYQRPEVQDIADFVGDSLGLSVQAGRTDAAVIVFCGVYFMAETAKIISPEKTVLIPDKEAGCPMADMITAEALRELKRAHPQAKVLCYVNTSAEVKAECDICCTSANAIQIVNGPLRNAQEIIFAPDKYLAYYLSTQTEREFIYWQGYCPTHIRIFAKDILEKKKLHPQAEVVVHPECTPEVIRLADKVFSTEGMCKYARRSGAKELIIGTEAGLVYRLSRENPDKIFYPVTDNTVCPNMKLITLEKVLWALEDMRYAVVIEESIRQKARLAVDRMLESERAD